MVAVIGEHVAGKYRVEGPLGEGGMGTVWVAVQEPLGRRVALKVISGTLDAVVRARFEREAKIVAQLRCPHIVTLHDFGDHAGAPYIVLELLEGQTLRDRLAKPMPVDEALSLARDIACGLRSAHESGVVHRDLKPENVFVVADKDRGVRAKLLDFGIAKKEDVRDGATVAGAIAGTIGYIAPEVVAHGPSEDPRIDLYALGVILFEMLAGAPPFEAPTALGVVMAHATQPAPDVRTRRAEVSASLAALVARLLEKEPSKRPASSDAVIAEIDALRAATGPTLMGLRPLEQVLGSGVMSMPERPSIAVTPFTAFGGEEEVAFAESVSEDVLVALGRFKHLFVVSTATMLDPQGRDTDPLRVGQRLGVRYVVQGNVRRGGGRLRLSTRLVDATTGAQMWGNRYDCDADELFTVQDDVVQHIVSSVAGHVEGAQAERARKMPPHTLAAYDWLARGRFHHHKRTREDNELSLSCLDRAVEVDPDLAPAHAWRACAYGQAGAFGTRPIPVTVEQANLSLKNALSLDDADSECHRMACELSFVAGDIEKAKHHHARAIALNPNDSRIVGQAGEVALYSGDLDEAVALLERAARLDPLNATPYLRLLARTRYVRRDLDEAWRLFRCIDDRVSPFVAVGAAIAALRGDDATELAAKAQPFARFMEMLSRLFVDPERRERWRSGFVAAKLLA